MSKSIRNLRLALLASAVVLGTAGCASPASREGMQVAATPTLHQSPQTVSVRTAGGTDTGALDSTNIADADFKAAIEESITQSKAFSRVIQGSGADYDLSVTVVRLTKPLGGFSMTVDMEAAWSLVKRQDKSVVMRKTIASTYTAGMSDAFAGVTRLRMAVEGAARANITQGLQEISALKL